MNRKLMMVLGFVAAVGVVAVVLLAINLTSPNRPQAEPPPSPSVTVTLDPPETDGPTADVTTPGGLTEADLARLHDFHERRVEGAQMVELIDVDSTSHLLPAAEVLMRQDLVAEHGWSVEDIMGDDGAFRVASTYVAARHSQSYVDGGLATMATARSLATGELAATLDAYVAEISEMGPTVGQVSLGEILTANMTLVYAARGLDEFGPTDHDHAVLFVNYHVDTNLNFPDQEFTDLVTVERTSEGWKVSGNPQLDLGNVHDGAAEAIGD
ncbi:hypothetical protein ACFWGN_14900 [Oerskovia sp. NPDC060338]|uniref:hypothetical protein n=1 Tax=Oerskovia sp. NPDC060338 TaxID=3347100 RepID=UPI00364EDB8C